MTRLELVRLAAKTISNPYFLGYALATGAESVDLAIFRDGGHDKFMLWNGALWSKQAEIEGIDRKRIAMESNATARHLDLIAAEVTLFEEAKAHEISRASEPHQDGLDNTSHPPGHHGRHRDPPEGQTDSSV